MRVLAAELPATGELRHDLDDDVADLIWSMNSAEYTQTRLAPVRPPENVASAVTLNQATHTMVVSQVTAKIVAVLGLPCSRWVICSMTTTNTRS